MVLLTCFRYVLKLFKTPAVSEPRWVLSHRSKKACILTNTGLTINAKNKIFKVYCFSLIHTADASGLFWMRCGGSLASVGKVVVVAAGILPSIRLVLA